MTYLTIFYWIIAFFMGISSINSGWKNRRKEGLKKTSWETLWILIVMALLFWLTKDNVF